MNPKSGARGSSSLYLSSHPASAPAVQGHASLQGVSRGGAVGEERRPGLLRLFGDRPGSYVGSAAPWGGAGGGLCRSGGHTIHVSGMNV